MALLYYFKVSGKSADVELFPPSLTEWVINVLKPAVDPNSLIQKPDGTIILLFGSESELTTFINSIKLNPSQQAQFDEWKTAHNINITFSVYELPTSDISVSAPF